MIDTFLSRLPPPGAQDGFMLIEVMISAMLVALIAVATFDGFTATQKVTADERAHNQATVLAQQDEERLRGLTATELSQLTTKETFRAENGICVEQVSGGWRYYAGAATSFCEKSSVYSGTYTGTVYTVNSSAKYVSGSSESLTCETEKGSADYIQTTSSVTWTTLGKRPAVSQSSQVDASGTSSLIVRVSNRNEEPVSGAKVEVFDPSTATTRTSEQTTSSAGCVIFGGLATGTVKVIASGPPMIDHASDQTPETTVNVSTGSQAEAKFTLNEPGGITAEFTGSTTGQSVKSFTFVAFQSEIASAASFFVGGSQNAANSSATLTGLFPFVTPGKPTFKENGYTVYAGDCAANDPATATGNEVKDAPVQVEPGSPKSVKVEVPEVKLTAYEGSSSSERLNALSYPTTTAKINNIECKGIASQNYTTVPYSHEVKLVNGVFEVPNLPYAKQLELCAVEYPVVKSGTKYYVKNTVTFSNTKKAGSTATLYLKASTSGKEEKTTPLSC
jgi:Tfp pilus assembly protein PilX